MSNYSIIQFLYLAIFFVVLILLYHSWDLIKFIKSGYKIKSGNSYFKTKSDSGCKGEYEIFLQLNKLKRLKGGGHIITNAYIPIGEGRTSEIDIIFIHSRGIYVLESKNYSGWVFGNEKHSKWTQTFPTGRKESFYNPIWQNSTHIKCLKYMLNKPYSVFKSIIIFGNSCTLKQVTVYSQTPVIKTAKVHKTLKKSIKKAPIVLTKKEVNDIYNKLKRYSNVSESVKRRHIENVKKYKLENNY